jgi:hypothetical protein
MGFGMMTKFLSYQFVVANLAQAMGHIAVIYRNALINGGINASIGSICTKLLQPTIHLMRKLQMIGKTGV